jgi:hypothetical protein
MSFHFPNVRVGPPVRFRSLSVFPLFGENGHALDYRLADEAMADSAVTVSEVSEQGSVPELFVENTGDVRVLFLESEEVRGAKQNRVLNTSVLVPARTKIKIPVSCVEQRRWRYTSPKFAGGHAMSPSGLRHALKGSVTQSVRLGAGHRSDQGTVWAQVQELHDKVAVSSPTAALADTYVKYDADIAAAREQLKYVDGACGLAVAVGNKVVSLDLFDKPTTCQKVWQRLLSGVVLDAVGSDETATPAAVADVERLLHESSTAGWQSAPAVGDGAEFRVAFAGNEGSALIADDVVVHGSVLAGQ